MLIHCLINLCCSLGSPPRCTGKAVRRSDSCWAARLCKQGSTSLAYVIFSKEPSPMRTHENDLKEADGSQRKIKEEKQK